MNQKQLEEKIDQQDEVIENLQTTVGELLDQLETYRSVLRAITLVALVEANDSNADSHTKHISTIQEFLKSSAAQH